MFMSCCVIAATCNKTMLPPCECKIANENSAYISYPVCHGCMAQCQPWERFLFLALSGWVHRHTNSISSREENSSYYPFAVFISHYDEIADEASASKSHYCTKILTILVSSMMVVHPFCLNQLLIKYTHTLSTNHSDNFFCTVNLFV